MSRNTYKILSIIGLVGAGLLTLSFFLPIIQGEVQVGDVQGVGAGQSRPYRQRDILRPALSLHGDGGP